jgi:hypothetical protein
MGLGLVTVLVLLCLTVLSADAAHLLYIRVGEYESMTRIVFEFDNTIKFKGPEIKNPRQVSVDFFDTTTVNPALQKMRDRSGRIEKIEFVQNKSLLTATIGLTASSFNLKSFYLFTPDRVVLDIYWTGAPVASVTAAPPVPESITQTHAEPTAVKPPETAMLGKEAENPVPQTSVDSNQPQSYLFMTLIGLSIVAIMIVLFVRFIFLKKRRRAVLPKNMMVSPERAARKMDDKLDEESINTLDSKILDELNKYGK